MPKTPAPPDALDALTFEQAMQRLEALVARLDADGLGLDAALASYEEGVAVAQHCLDRLRTAEVRIQTLTLE